MSQKRIKKNIQHLMFSKNCIGLNFMELLLERKFGLGSHRSTLRKKIGKLRKKMIWN